MRRIFFRAAVVGGAGGGAGLAAMQYAYAVPEERRRALRDGPWADGSGEKTAVVIGAGVVGLTTARELTRAGYKVRILEKCSGPALAASAAPAGHIAVSTYHASVATLGFLMSSWRALLTDPKMDHIDEPDDLIKCKFVKIGCWADWNFLAWGASWVHLALRHFSQWDAVGPVMKSVRVPRVEMMKKVLVDNMNEEGLSAECDMHVDGRITVAYHTYHNSGFGMRKRGEKFVLLNAHEVVEREPWFDAAHRDGLIRGGTFYADDTYAECQSYCKGLARVLEEKHGVSFDYGVSVKGLETSNARMSGVRLQSGELVQGDIYVLCAGNLTPELAVTAGIHCPITAMQGYKTIAPGNGEGRLPKSAMVVKPYELYSTPLKGEVHFAAFGEFAPRWDDKPTREMEERLDRLIQQVYPNVEELVDWGKRRHVMGRRPQTPDGNPVVSPTRIEGLYINAGHCSYGFRGSLLSAMLLVNGLKNGFEDNGIFWRLTSLARYQPANGDWGSCLDASRLPCVDKFQTYARQF